MARPMRPKPTTPSVLPWTSPPSSSMYSHCRKRPSRDVAVGLDHAAGRGHEQRPGEVGRGIGEDVGRVGDHDAAPRAGRHVDVVVADRDVGDHAQARPGREQRLVDDLADHADEALLAGQALEQLGPRHGRVLGVRVHLGPAPCELDGRLRQLTGDQDRGSTGRLWPSAHLSKVLIFKAIFDLTSSGRAAILALGLVEC